MYLSLTHVFVEFSLLQRFVSSHIYVYIDYRSHPVSVPVIQLEAFIVYSIRRVAGGVFIVNLKKIFQTVKCNSTVGNELECSLQCSAITGM